MKIQYSALVVLGLALLLCSCNPGTTVVNGKGSVTSKEGKNITLRTDGQPNAQISATGDLSVDGKQVLVSAPQRALLQSYHHEMNAMTVDGIAIGKQGAALAGKAVTEAIKGAFNGKGDQVKGNVEADARKIQDQAMQLCKRLVTIKATQDQLAAELPAFKPYANIDLQDVDDCGSKQDASYAAGEKVGSSLAKATRGDPADEVEADAVNESEGAGKTH